MKYIKENKTLFVTTSTIPNAGNGLFAKKAIPANKIICYFKGELINDEEASNRNVAERRHSFVQLASGMVLDTYNADCFAKWANDARNKKKNNCEIFTTGNGKGAYLSSSKEIAAGAELFFDYGVQYWETIQL